MFNDAGYEVALHEGLSTDDLAWPITSGSAIDAAIAGVCFCLLEIG
jgi:hypothetical protein